MSWWETFWDEYYLHKLSLQKSTKNEADFVAKVLSLRKNEKVLDLGCGIGRHSIELAKKGYDVTGLDFSKVYIKHAKEDSKKIKNVRFVCSDMRKLKSKNKFDAIICMYTSFGYFSEKENLNVLKRVNSALKQNGRFFIDVINKEAVLKNFSPKIKFKTDYGKIIQKSKFDYSKSRLNSFWTFYVGDKKAKTGRTSFRLYSYLELKEILEKAGFQIIGNYGDFGKEDVNPNSKRIILVCKK